MLYQKISDDIKHAMKNQDSIRLDVLRMMKTKIMTVDARGELPDEEIIKILRSYQKSLKDAIEQMRAGGRDENARELQKEIEIVSEYLPSTLPEVEIRALIEGIIKHNHYSSKADIGKVMKELMSSGKSIDGTVARSILSDLLL